MFENGNQEQHQPSLFLTQNLSSQHFKITNSLFIVLFNIISVVFAVIGIFLLFTHDVSTEYTLEYGKECGKNPVCIVHLNITDDIPHPIALMYEIKGLYQNHLHSMRSRNDEQLLGSYVRFEQMLMCKPFRSIDDDPSPNKWILPCGLEGQMFFNDTFEIRGLNPLNGPNFPITGIAPHELNTMYQTGVKWLESKEEYLSDNLNLRFAAWMDTAAFSSFRRIYGITSETGYLKKQILTIVIQNNFDVSKFNGTKSIVLAEKDSYPPSTRKLGIFYMVASCLMLLSTSTLVIINRILPLPSGAH